MYLKYPVKRGETWDVPYMYYHIIKQRFEYRPDSALVYTCLSENQKISTEIGEFNCVNYYFREKPAEDVLEYWDYFISYTPGVGLIEMDIKSALDNRMIQKIIIVEYKTK
ncbi:MAG: hypothetical protein COZ80_10300 [Ignavibacteria bacterium CG_4_8_14_3_um_filter_37_9]|nr:hypothetical protein [Ignavibacteria bacterium]NCS90272.1 hypothetical protein [Ignavibacteria bacterium]OIO14927.1 MAG: hypothetical protein AUJ54_13640 [Ignavibacteria bacterium CG1_02_37_35]PIW98500.1 MAG: hypothetical protein COZ80_10300 [Ignavibacteria bacterium CG_4_8_14_3_um_filter_37_9]PJC60577.1 MAG: hypothetical protein CO025_02790 [Ignavibacteria bacterium CG_4_9_14_0_2_um_filter_37_13]